MLVVRLEVWPHGDEKRAKEIGRIEICNMPSTDDNARGDYAVAVSGDVKVANTLAEIYNHDRESSAWRLVQKAIDAVLGVYR